MTSRSQLISGSHYHPPSALAPQRRAAAGSWTVRRRYWVLLVLAIGITLATVGAVHIKATMLGGTYARGGVSGDAIARVPRRGLQDHRRQHGIPFAREVMQSVATAETLSTNGSLPLLDSRRKQQAAQWLRKHLRRQPPSVVMHQGLDVEQDGASDPTEEALAVAKRTPQPIPFTVSPTPRLQTPLAPRSVQPPPAVVSRPPHIVHDAVVDAAVQAIQNGARPQDVFRRGRRQGYRRNVNFVVPTPPETEEVVPPAARTLPPVPPTAYTPADADAWTSLPRMAIISLNYRDMASAGGAKASWMHPMSYANKVAYCKKWGYDLIIEDNTLVDPQRDPAWGKIPILRKWLPKYQWIMWVDMDAFFMRFDLPATDLISDAHDMVIAKDWHGINFGIFLMRNSEWSLRLLDLMWYTPPRWWKPWEEQSALMALLKPHLVGPAAAVEIESRIMYRDQREMNSYHASFVFGHRQSSYVEGDRMVHFPNCKGVQSCQIVVRQMFEYCARLYPKMRNYANIAEVPMRVVPDSAV